MFRYFAVASICAVILILAPNGAHAQSVNDGGLWFAFFGQGDFLDNKSNKLKWWFDGHARFLDDADGFNQSIVRPGIGYQLTENTTAWVGYGWIRTSPLAGSDFDENRIWQQLTWSKTYNPFTFALRPRLEQRFLETGDDVGWRFRQLFRVQHNLPDFPHLILVGWDEAFFHLNDTDWGAKSGFDQNRVFVGFGYRPNLSASWRVEVGYLNQTINIPGRDDRVNHILSINLYR